MQDGERNVTKLTQYLTALQDKLATIATLDTEILDATEGKDGITNKIEQADTIQEMIETTILEIQDALSNSSSPHGRAMREVPVNGCTNMRQQELAISPSTEVPSSRNQQRVHGNHSRLK